MEERRRLERGLRDSVVKLRGEQEGEQVSSERGNSVNIALYSRSNIKERAKQTITKTNHNLFNI